MPKFASPDGLPVLTFADADGFEAWLSEEHDRARGLWIAIAKKKSGVASIDAAQAIEVCLCFGWIDGQRRGCDDVYFLQRFTHRRARSPWSQINRDKALELIDNGRMRPAGLVEIERAQQDGRWDAAYASARTITVPEDFQMALDADPEAAAFFETLTGQNRYAFLYRIHEAKRPETRARRIEKFIGLLRKGETI